MASSFTSRLAGRFIRGRREGTDTAAMPIVWCGAGIRSVFLAAFLGASSWAQAADLLGIFHAAQANDPVFAAARATQQAGQEKLPQGRSLLMP